MSETMLPIYVIHRNPRDGKFVLRRHQVTAAGEKPDREPMAVKETLHGARAALPLGMTCIGRMPEDDPSIVEVWL